ncbi:solute carrier organic anion transporter family member 2B1-like [Ceratina calcarata]|uniref:Solute carrier organic anion transporter family member 2B1-like n=1 Tax=Ceratina calcarata TaxID=156304 RepID=A0AAJ7WDT6_9HYME|nr:solute carrier organic anion transporter family member 2B1-like [Ceratina calcarata]
MAIGLSEVMRSEVEGGLAGPANPIPHESLDCGCRQLPCPKLAKFATRRLFVGLLSWVGFIQSAAYAYLYIATPTISRRFQFDPYTMEWALAVSEISPVLFGIVIAYWGDRIHRPAWIGGIVILQSVSYFTMIIPHLTHQTKVVEEAKNITHMSIYSDDNRQICLETSSRIVSKGEETCYFTLTVIFIVQFINGMANVVYYALGISYLDDNTKKKNVAVFISELIAVKITGVLLGFILAWVCLGIDAEKFTPIQSYREQIGAWWLGFPIFSLLLIVPGLLISWYPRILPSEVVEQAAASLLNIANRYDLSPRPVVRKIASPKFFPSLGRLMINKTLICQILAFTLYITAIVNFMGFENLIAQSRYHIPKPTGMLLGFEDPTLSRLIANMFKPILVGLIIIMSGLVIARAKPEARSVVIHGIVVVLLACGIIFALVAADCDRKNIVSESDTSLELLQYCNKDCGCSDDTDFRPVCDRKSEYTFYSPCHAGCTMFEERNGVNIYSECDCVKEKTNSTEAIDGPCNLNCHASWIIFEVATLLVYILVSSTFVGDVMVILRSVNSQDKAISIGLSMTFISLIVYMPGKVLYDVIANLTCEYSGTESGLCRLHNGTNLGNYLYYTTGSLLALSVILKILVWIFCEDMNLYAEKQQETSTELQVYIRNPAGAAADREQTEQDLKKIKYLHTYNEVPVQVEVTNESLRKTASPNEDPLEEEEDKSESVPLKYGPIGPGDRRTNSKSSLNSKSSQTRKPRIRNIDSEDELGTSDDERKTNSNPNIDYAPLDIDSDVESDLSSAEPRSRKRIVGIHYDPVYTDQDLPSRDSIFEREFPNPDNYEDPRLNRRNQQLDGSKNDEVDGSDKMRKKGDFNEVGIPIMDPYDSNSLKKIKSLIDQYEQNAEQQETSNENGSYPDGKIISGIPLVAMTSRRSSRDQGSSRFSTFDAGKVAEGQESRGGSVSPKTSSKGSAGTLHTDF